MKFKFNNWLSTIGCLLIWIIKYVESLRDIQLSVPEAVNIGETATLGCRWTLDPGETLYTVKWYHGPSEFYRYIPKELPHTRVFQHQGLIVDVNKSGAQQVLLKDVSRDLSGRYRCEVSADAPYFHTVYKTSFMHVIDFPMSPPLIMSEKSWYTTGDLLRANCTSAPSDPPSNLTWLLNGEEVKGLPINLEVLKQTNKKIDLPAQDTNTIIVTNTLPASTQSTKTDKNNLILTNHLTNPSYTKTTTSAPSNTTEVKTTSIYDLDDTDTKSASASILVVRVQSEHFIKGRINLTCIAKIYTSYMTRSELVVEEERPQLAPVMESSRDSSAGLMYGNIACLTTILLYIILDMIVWSIR